MCDYSFYCTKEQTKKALDLGAPICCIRNGMEQKIKPLHAEQMMEWLRSKGFIFKIVEHESDVYTQRDVYWQYAIGDYFDHDRKPSAKEAMLAVIDAALEYLKNPKQ